MYPALIKRVGLKSDISMTVQMSVPVLRAAAANTYNFNFTVYVTPTGTDGSTGAQRLAQSGEVECRIQYSWGMSAWTDFAVVKTDANGKATITVTSNNMRFPSTYQATVKHVASSAQVGAQFTIDASGNVGALGSPTTISKGSIMAATFQQENLGDRAFRSLAFPETRAFPFAGLHQTRGQDIAFPEVRQWTRTGPETYLPGQKVQVRQSPNSRRPTV
jgi:hypothetical protein